MKVWFRIPLRFGRGTVSSGQHVLVLDVEQVLLDLGRGLVGRLKNDVARVKELEQEMVKLKAQVNANFNGPRNVLNKIEEVRQELRRVKNLRPWGWEGRRWACIERISCIVYEQCVVELNWIRLEVRKFFKCLYFLR